MKKVRKEGQLQNYGRMSEQGNSQNGKQYEGRIARMVRTGEVGGDCGSRRSGRGEERREESWRIPTLRACLTIAGAQIEAHIPCSFVR